MSQKTMPELSQQHVCSSCCYRETCCTTTAIQSDLCSGTEVMFAQHWALKHCPFSFCHDHVWATELQYLVRKWVFITLCRHGELARWIHLFENSALCLLTCLKVQLPSFHICSGSLESELLMLVWSESCLPSRGAGCLQGPEHICPSAPANALH